MDFLLSPWVLGCSIVGGLFTYWLFTRPYKFFAERNLPFHKPLPFLGNMAPMVFYKKSLPDFYLDLYRAFEGYSVAGFFEFLTPVFVIRDPQIIKNITVKDFEHFMDHRLQITEKEDPLFGRNLFAMKGDRWRDMRHTLSPAFTSSKMKAMFLLISECGEQLGEYVANKCKGERTGMLTLEMKDLFTRYANDVIATTAFGVHCDSLGEQDNEFYMVGKDMTNSGGLKLLLVFCFQAFAGLMRLLKITFISRRNSRFFRELVHTTIAVREQQKIVRPDMIHLLMQARKGLLKKDDADEVDVTDHDPRANKSEMTDDDITAQAIIFFFAGFDTSSTVLSFAAHLLAINPDAQKRLQEEIDETMVSSGGKATYEAVQSMKYLDMVISETLRMYPPAVFNERLCSKAYTIPATDTNPSIRVEKGDGIVIPTYGLHFDPKYFPEPEKFDPERFSEENKSSIAPFTYMPFGAGPRLCIGNRFALLETKVALVNLLSRMDLHAVPKTPVPMKLEKNTFGFIAEGGFWVGFRLRNKSL